MNELITKLKAEIENDPDGLYAGKTAKQIADLINSPVKKTVTVEVPDIVVDPIPTKQVQKEVITDAPVFRVINGIAGAPNVVTEADVTEALK